MQLCGTEILMMRGARSCHLPVMSSVNSWILLLVPSVGYSHSRHPCGMNGHGTISGLCQNFCARVHLAHWSTQLANSLGCLAGWNSGLFCHVNFLLMFTPKILSPSNMSSTSSFLVFLFVTNMVSTVSYPVVIQSSLE
jgi:hypothetical protein